MFSQINIKAEKEISEKRMTQDLDHSDIRRAQHNIYWLRIITVSTINIHWIECAVESTEVILFS